MSYYDVNKRCDGLLKISPENFDAELPIKHLAASSIETINLKILSLIIKRNYCEGVYDDLEKENVHMQLYNVREDYTGIKIYTDIDNPIISGSVYKKDDHIYFNYDKPLILNMKIEDMKNYNTESLRNLIYGLDAIETLIS